jgi:RHS repeat-associated protein
VRAGLEPNISLEFVNGAPNGLMGPGWSIGGLSSISRCPRIAATNNRWVRPVEYNDTDQLCFDGKPLVLTDGTHFQPGAEYRTEVDSFDRVVAQSDGVRLSFKVQKKDGRIFYYGGSLNAELHRDRERQLVRAWALARIEDTVGNFISFSYGKFVSSGRADGDPDQTAEFWPAEIAYGGLIKNGVRLVQPRRSLLFQYSNDRNDYMEGFSRGGALVARTKLLTQIDVKLGDAVVRRYELGYENAPGGAPIGGLAGPKRLHQITECAHKTGVLQCKRPTVIEYLNQQGLRSTANGTAVTEVTAAGLNTRSDLIVLDWNGDGQDDIVVTHGNVAPTLLIATDDPAARYTKTTGTVLSETCFSQNSVFDYTGDGRDDLLDTCNDDVYVSTGDAQNPFVRDDGRLVGGFSFGNRSFLADLNGDGVKDVWSCGVNVSYQLGSSGNGDTGEGFSDPQGEIPPYLGADCFGGLGAITGHPAPVLVADIDGDGADDVLMSSSPRTEGWARYVPRPDGTASWRPLPALPIGLELVVRSGQSSISDSYRYGLVQFADMNGDGLNDIFALLTQTPFRGRPDPLKFEPIVFTNLGGFFDEGHDAYWCGNAVPRRECRDTIQNATRATPYSIGGAIIADYTGDGRDDIMRMFSASEGQSTSSLWQLDVGAISHPSIPGELGALPVLLPDPAALPNGESNFVPPPQTTPMVRVPSRQPDSGAPITALADADGDGSDDLVMVASNGDLVVMPARFGREHLLSSVTDGMGKRITVDYEISRSFSDGVHPVYASGVFSGNGQCLDSDPEQGFSLCARRSKVGPLVSHYLVQKEEGGTFRVDRSFALRYEGGREGLRGRGYLGFTRRIIEERAPGAVFMQRTEIFEDNRSFDFGFDFFPRTGLERRRVVTTPVAGSALATQATFRRVTRVNDWGEIADVNLKLSSKGRPFPALDETTTTVEEVTADGQAHLVSRERTVFALPDAFGNIIHKETTTEDATGAVSKTVFDTSFDIRAGDEWLISLPKRVQVSDDALRDAGPAVTRVVEYDYDSRGLLERITREPEEDQNAAQAAGLRQETTYERDPDDPFQVVRKVTTTGAWLEGNDQPASGTRVTSLEYDDETMFPRHIYRHNGATDCAFSNSHTAECQTTDVSYDPRDGTLVTRVDPTGVGEKMTFDPFGRILEHETARDTITTRYTDALAPPSPFFPIFPKIEIETTSENTGARVTRRFDAFNRVVQQEKSGVNGATIDQELQYLTGELVSRVSRQHLRGDATQGETQQLYDDRFRPRQRTFADGTDMQFQYATAGLIAGTMQAEPGEASVSGIVDRNGRRSLNFSGARGVEVRHVDAKGNSIRYAYGAFKALEQVVEPVAGEEDHVTAIVSDKLGRVLEHRDGDSGRTRYGYTAFDDTAHHRDNMNRVISVRYDDLGRVQEMESGADGFMYFAYDGPGDNAIGRLVETVSFDGNLDHYTYEPPPASDDPLDNRAFLRRLDRSIAGTPFATTLHYNDNSQISQIDYPSSPTSADPNDDEAFAVHYGYDGTGNLTCISDRAISTSSECGAGRFWKLEQAFQGELLQQESFGNGVTTSYGYDDLNGYLRSIVTQRGSSAYQSITYPLYDNNGNLRRRAQAFANPAGGPSTSIDESFHYDELDRLTDVFLMNGSVPVATLQSVEYADNGNIVDKADVGEYDYSRRPTDSLRGPHAVRRILRGGVEAATYQYDAVGNMTQRDGQGVDGGRQIIGYTGFNLPETVIIGTAPIGAGGSQIRYGYDANMRRVHMTLENDTDGTPELTRFYVGSAYERVDTEDAGGAVTRHLYKVFAHDRQIAQVEREVRSGVSVQSRRYIHSDHQGSSQVITNETGELVHVQRFDAFGKSIAPANDSTDAATRNIRAGYTGHETDSETGLVNMRGRIYDPRLGRFMQADPIARFGGTQKLNRYSYVLNNPLNLTDPTGLTDSGSDNNNDSDDAEDEPASEDDYEGVVASVDDEGNLVLWDPDCKGCDAAGGADATPTSSDADAMDAPSADEIAAMASEGDPNAGGANDTPGSGEEASNTDTGNADDADMGDDEESENPQTEEASEQSPAEAGNGEGAQASSPGVTNEIQNIALKGEDLGKVSDLGLSPQLAKDPPSVGPGEAPKPKDAPLVEIPPVVKAGAGLLIAAGGLQLVVGGAGVITAGGTATVTLPVVGQVGGPAAVALGWAGVGSGLGLIWLGLDMADEGLDEMFKSDDEEEQ